MESFFAQLPKSIVVFLSLALGIILLFVFNPPKTVCDTHQQALREIFKGRLFATQKNKRTFPPSINRAEENCLGTPSVGGCYEYFSILRQIAKEMVSVPAECTSKVLDITEIKKALQTGIERVVVLAWGDTPPQPGPNRFGWYQESELALFCRLKEAYIRAQGEEGWTQLRESIYKTLPGGKDPRSEGLATSAPSARSQLGDTELWNRSLFSLRCDNYK